MFGDLLSGDGVVERLQLAGRVGVMALHGGLEAGTAEAATGVAEAVDASLYTVVQPEGLRLHVPSTMVDPRDSEALRTFLGYVALAISFHGFGRPGYEDAVLVGGSNRRVAAAVGRALARRTSLRPVVDLATMPPELRGVHPANPVNLPEFGGVQLELSAGARRAPFVDELVAAVAAVAAEEQRSLCVGPGGRGTAHRGASPSAL